MFDAKARFLKEMEISTIGNNMKIQKLKKHIIQKT